MISSFTASLLMLFVFGVCYWLLRQRLVTSRFYFILLFFMGVAGTVLPLDKYVHYYSTQYNATYILLFSLLVVMTLIPWIKFDKAYRTWGKIYVKDMYLKTFKIVFVINISLGVYAVAYAIPYAMMAFSMGADDVRLFITNDSFYPHNLMTTICVGVGYLTPIQIFLFYISLLHQSLRKFSILLFLTSLSYLITMLPYASRDGFIFIPLTYYFTYKLFSSSLSTQLRQKIKKYAFVAGGIIVLGVLFITYQRFYLNPKSNLNALDSVIYGTWGYFFQQPFVFEQNLSYDVSDLGFGRRFEIINILFGIPKHYYTTDALTTSFGTMYAEFFHCYGWSSLIGFSLFYYISFSLLLDVHIIKRNYSSILLVHIIYLYYTISGLFYYKMFLLSVTELYILILTCSLFLRNMLGVSKPNFRTENH